MGLPGGGRSEITQRLQRHFNIIGYVDIDDIVINTMFGSILNGFVNKYSDDVKNLTDIITESTIDLYHSVCSELLPTPAKSH